MSQKIPIFDVRLSYKYASAAGLKSYKVIFQPCFYANLYYLSSERLFAIFLRWLLGQGCSVEEASTTLNQAKYFSFAYHFSEAATRGALQKKMSLKIWETSHENTRFRVSF